MASKSNVRERTELLGRLWQAQLSRSYISDQEVDNIASEFGMSGIELEGVLSFYHFFRREPAGKFTIYLSDNVVARTRGYSAVLKAFEQATGAKVGSVDPTGQFGLFTTSCIGLSDVEPSALINFQPFTELDPQKVRALVWQLKSGVPVEELADPVPVRTFFKAHTGNPVLLRHYPAGLALHQLKVFSSTELLEEIARAGLRGMGGAFFPVSTKWEACRKQRSREKYIVCNADEGEPGTFKDRLLLQTRPEMVLDGMILAGYCTGARQGILYLRGEYHWLKATLEAKIAEYRERGLLGQHLPAREEFSFDIRLELGAGAYVCGEETALLNSMEGKRGEPRVRTYFPVEKGFLGKPTVVNNVETFALVASAIDLGSDLIRSLGTADMPGTRLISVAGDCRYPGVYEIEWGTSLGSILDWCGADDPWYVQVSGPSGIPVAATQRDRVFDLGDLRCGGALTVFRQGRDLLGILQHYTDFFRVESCGVCTPCRAGNLIFSRKLEKIAKGLANQKDREEIREWSTIMQSTCRCGLGRSATNALTQALEAFPDYFASFLENRPTPTDRSFSLSRAVADYEAIVDP